MLNNEVLDNANVQGLFYLGLSAAFLTAICWTLSASIYKKGEVFAGSLTGGLARGWLSLAFLMALAWTLRENPLSNVTTELLLLTLVSTVTGLIASDTLYIYTIRRIGLSCAVPIASTSLVFSAFINWLALGIELTLPILMGTMLIMLGIWFISADSNLLRADPIGLALAVLGAVLWSVSVYFLTLISYTHSSLGVNFWRVLWLALFSVPSVTYHTIKDSDRGIKLLLFMGLGGVLALGLGWWSFTYALQTVGPERTVPIAFLSTIFSILVGKRVFKERAGLRKFVGVALAFLGTFFVSM
jgi:drug/metabolite transporter (DMT)-like permease